MTGHHDTFDDARMFDLDDVSITRGATFNNGFQVTFTVIENERFHESVINLP